MRYLTTIFYTIKETHPDKDCLVGGWTPDRVLHFSDTYIFNDDYEWTEEAAIIYMKRDLTIVANGGYTKMNYIDNVTFQFSKLS